MRKAYEFLLTKDQQNTGAERPVNPMMEQGDSPIEGTDHSQDKDQQSSLTVEQGHSPDEEQHSSLTVGQGHSPDEEQHSSLTVGQGLSPDEVQHSSLTVEQGHSPDEEQPHPTEETLFVLKLVPCPVVLPSSSVSLFCFFLYHQCSNEEEEERGRLTGCAEEEKGLSKM